MEATFTFRSDRVDGSNQPHQEFMRRAIDNNLNIFVDYRISSETPVTAAFDWPPLVQRLDETRESRLMQSYTPQGRAARILMDGGDSLVSITHWGQYENGFSIAGRTPQQVAEILAWFVQRFPVLTVEDPDVVPIKFWALTKTGVSHRTRLIEAPLWDNIALNYTERTSNGLAEVLDMQRPEGTGRLMLWHGKPGTGKSYAIRSLARAWKPWCDTHYIVDPEHFFGDSDYMLTVIFDYASEATESAPALAGSGPIENTSRFTLLIMEDADEFLGIDAKRREGQSMARLLNMCDGLIGQGLNLLLLITTNEPLEKIHKAVQREGRCLANVEFGQLSGRERQDWLGRHDLTDESLVAINTQGVDKTLAELYALTRAHRQVKVLAEEKTLGFRGQR